jgi:hypothetical protein
MANGVNYEDERFTKVEEAKTEALNENEAMYQGMIDKSDGFYQAQIDASKEFAETQKDLMNQQTDFAVEQIEQQKAQAEKDYQKEQSAAYTDYQKQSNEYSVGAEQRAASGLSNTGYSESSQVAMYTAYQNRVATTKASYDKIVMNYNNDITAARLQNSSKLAELAYHTQQTQLQLALDGFQYNNQLLLDKANKKLEIDNMYYGRWKDVLSQLNQENALAEEIRQYNESLAEEKRQANANYAINKAKLAEEKRQANANYALNKAKLAEEKRQFDAQMAYTKSKSNGSYSRSSVGDGGYMVIDPAAKGDAPKNTQNPLNKLIGYNITSEVPTRPATTLPPAQAALQKKGYSLVKDITGKGIR